MNARAIHWDLFIYLYDDCLAFISKLIAYKLTFNIRQLLSPLVSQTFHVSDINKLILLPESSSSYKSSHSSEKNKATILNNISHWYHSALSNLSNGHLPYCSNHLYHCNHLTGHYLSFLHLYYSMLC